MTLQFQPPETGTSSAQLSAGALPAPETVCAVRYDAVAVRETIALAQALQARHRETKTQTDVENLGRELGLETEFVRRALLQIGEAKPLDLIIAPHTNRRRKRLRSARLKRRQKIIALFPAALYALLLPIAAYLFRGEALTYLYLFLPAFLAFATGFKERSLRVGAVTGFSFGLATLLTLLIFSNRYGVSLIFNTPSWNELVRYVDDIAGFGSIFLGIGTGFGVGGAGLRYGIQCLRRTMKNAASVHATKYPVKQA